MASTARRLLVSIPTLDDPNFFRSVVFVIEHNDDGAVGLVLNQPTDAVLTDALPDWADLAAPPAVAFVGGPVQQHDAVIGLARVGRVEDSDAWQPLIGRVGTIDLGRTPADVRGDLEAIARVRRLLGMGPRSARRRDRTWRLVRGRRAARRSAHARSSVVVARRCCGARVVSSRSRRTIRSIRADRQLRSGIDHRSERGSFGRCRRRRSRTHPDRHCASRRRRLRECRVQSRAGPTPASRSRTASAPTARRAGSTTSVTRSTMAEIRQAEQRAAAKVVGVTDVTFLGYPDGRLVSSIELRRDISRVIRRVRPQRVVGQSPERNFQRMLRQPSRPPRRGRGDDGRGLPRRAQPVRARRSSARRGSSAWAVRRDVPRDDHHAPTSSSRSPRPSIASSTHCGATRSQMTDLDGLDARIRAWNSANAADGGLPAGGLAESYLRVDTQ